jgi:prevent-host-death family protein
MVCAYGKADAAGMSTLTASETRAQRYRLMDQAAESHAPILITGKRSHAVLVSEADWAAIQETGHLRSVPGMRESIRTGLVEPLSACSDKLDG